MEKAQKKAQESALTAFDDAINFLEKSSKEGFEVNESTLRSINAAFANFSEVSGKEFRAVDDYLAKIIKEEPSVLINGQVQTRTGGYLKVFDTQALDASMKDLVERAGSLSQLDPTLLKIKNTLDDLGGRASFENLSILRKSSKDLIASRPTAINLKWAVDRMIKKLTGINNNQILDIALKEAKEICDEDENFCKNIGINGLKLIEEIYNKKKSTVNILTHCNAGWLATINWGTATSPIYHAHKKGIPVHVWVDETRPRNQGANLTSYELNEEEIPNTIIADNTGGILMQRGEVDMCVVGTDRTLSNGDVCNKIGTYLKALAAYDNNVPFYVALPSSTIDWNIKDAKDIPIEDRNSEELSHVEGIDENNQVKKVLIYPQKSKAMNLAFDVTPAKYVTGLITERGISEASSKGLKELFKK